MAMQAQGPSGQTTDNSKGLSALQYRRRKATDIANDDNSRQSAKPRYDGPTSGAINTYQHGDAIVQGNLTNEEKGTELGYSPSARANVGYFTRGQGERALKNANPDLTDRGVSETMRVAPKTYTTPEDERRTAEQLRNLAKRRSKP